MQFPWPNKLLSQFCEEFWKDHCLSNNSTTLLKKDAFRWCSKVDKAFHKLKEAMSSTLVFALPKCDKLPIEVAT